MSQDSARSTGLTLRAFGWILLGLFLIGGIIQFSGIFKGDGYQLGGEVIPMPAFIIFGIWVALGALAKKVVGWRWLTPPEMIVVLYALMLATPIMSTGFWRFYLSTVATVPRFNAYDKYDALSPKAWPHGDNLFEVAFKNEGGELRLDPNVRPETFETGNSASGEGYVINNTDDSVSAMQIEVPVYQGEDLLMPLEEPYLFTALVRAKELGPRSNYFVRIRFDDRPETETELIRSRVIGKVTPLQPEGFFRVAAYGVELPHNLIDDQVTIEIGLEGRGIVDIADLQWLNVGALEFAYTSRRAISEAEYAQLPETIRGAYTMIPDNMWSLAGLKTAITGHVPWGAWGESFVFLGGYVFLLTLASLAVACLLRRQWMQSERFPVPLIYGPMALVDGARPWHGGKPYTKQPLFWIGYGIFVFWCLLMGLSFLNPSIPSPVIDVPLRGYFTDPAWMKVWGVSFTVLPLALAVALFFEINVLASLLVGFVLFRLQFLVGEWTGASVDQQYPYKSEQMTGSFLMYAIVILWLARRFLSKAFQAAWKGETSEREMLSPRGSLILLGVSLVGVLLWSIWAQLSIIAALGIFLLFVIFMLVAMRIRTEIGMTGPNIMGGRDSASVLVLMSLVGSLTIFGPEGMVLGALISALVMNAQVSFMMIPGMQMEFVEAGSRGQVKGRSIVSAAILGIVGGMVVGGWIYFSGAYAVGADNFPIPGQFSGEKQAFNELSAQVGVYEEAAKREASPWAVSWLSAQGGALAFGALGTLVLSLVRQAFAGFWFHPAGFVLGPTGMLEQTWGAITFALLIRFLVLRLGGAAAVREKLFPFAAGGIAGVATAMAFFLADQAFRFFFNPSNIKFPMQF